MDTRPHGRGTTDVLALLERCGDLERMAASVYETLALRFAADAELAALWASLARDEHDHAGKLDALREPMARVATQDRTRMNGLDEHVADVHWLLAESRIAATTADEEEAFAIALAIENSELDAITAAVLQVASRTARPNVVDLALHDTADHHEKLLALVRQRCRAGTTLRRAALLAAHHPQRIASSSIFR